MAGKSVLVTGGIRGIGMGTAAALAALGARVGITGRDQARAAAAAAGIRAATGNPAVDVFAADMSVQAEVRRLAAQVADTYPRLDVLVNNVGGFRAHRHVTADELARRLEGTGVTATVLHPGVVRTSFGAEDQAAHFAFVIRAARPFMKTPARGTVTPVYLASSPQVEGVTGQCFANRKPKTSAKAACDTAAATRLWKASADLAGLTATA
jgi:NAD(P)-dependent dehydrogenase (short-subunit alcohol dehydrogenase family)